MIPKRKLPIPKEDTFVLDELLEFEKEDMRAPRPRFGARPGINIGKIHAVRFVLHFHH
jgi:hypothetical protein